MDKVTILSVKTGEAVKNVNDLKQNIKLLKEQLGSLEIGTQEYQQTLQSLQVNQNALKDAMHGTAASMQQVTEAATMSNVAFNENNALVNKETVSYNELVHTLADLKQAWRASTDETERAAIGEKINAVNNRLKELDASTGSYVRNVGNYKSALDGFAGGMASMGKGAAAAVQPIKNVTLGLNTMSKTPVIAILGILVNVLAKVISALKSSEEGSNKLTEALAPFNAIADVLTRTLQGLGDVVAGLVNGFVKLAESIFGTNKATEQRVELAKMEKQLAEQTRETIVANAEAERDVAELRAKASDKLTYTAQERLEFLKQAGDKEAEISQRAMQDAKLQYEIIKAKNAFSKSNKVNLDAEAQAYAAMVKAETDYYNTIRSINAGITRATREETSAARAAVKDRDEARKAELESYKALLSQEIALLEKTSAERLAKQKELLLKEYEAAVANAKDKIKNEETLSRTLLALQKKYHKDVRQADHEHQLALRNNELLAMENTANAYAKGTVENLRALKDARAYALETMQREEGETEAEWNKRKIDAQWAYVEAVQALNKKAVESTTQELDLAYAKSAHTQEETLAYEQSMAEARVRQIEMLGKELGETEEAYQTRLYNARREAKEKEEAMLDYYDQQEVLKAENRMNALQEGTLEYMAAAVDLKKTELDTLHKLESESEEEFHARQIAADKEYYDAKRALAQAYVSTIQDMVGGVSSLLGSLADIYEADTDASEQQVKAAKNLRIAGATIDMLSGVVTAIAQAQQLGPVAGPIMAGINSAAVIAAGVANIKKIRKQQVSATASSNTSTDAVTPAQVQAPTYVPEMQQVRTITGASETDILNRISDQRVYILASDIEASQQTRRVQVAETSF